MSRLVRAMVGSYRRLGLKPMKGVLEKVYNRYRTFYRKKTVIATVDAITYELDLNETIDSAIYFGGAFEPHTTEAINRLCQEGMVVLDVGANIGCHTLRFAKLVGTRGRVIAFEPMSWAFRKLTRNVALNAFSNLSLEKIALSDANRAHQEVAFATSWPLSGIDEALLHPLHGGYAEKDVVDFMTLDEYIRTRKVGRIDFMKIDVDGYELKVVRGATETLALWKPVMIMELGNAGLAQVGDHIEDLVSLLSDLGYRFFAERDLQEYPSIGAMLSAIPEKSTMNVVLSGHDL